MMSSKDRVLHIGLDYPDVIGFWEPNELMIASSSFMLFILVRTVLLGGGVCLLLLYSLPKLKDHHVRGRQDHFLWRIGLLTGKGFEFFPPACVTRFDA